MAPNTRPVNAGERPPQPGEAVVSASGKLQVYGYHNTFHTHALPSIIESTPPSYDFATSPHHGLRSSDLSPSLTAPEALPEYTCTIHWEGLLAIKSELASPFLVSLDKNWHTIYAVLHGTQLSIYRLKSNSLFKTRAPTAGRLLKTYSLQHAEIGMAADWKKGELTPRSAFAKMLPKTAQKKLWETDPDLFEPTREFVIRLRLETEQLLLCADTQESMLDWIEAVCTSIDIAAPLEDRSEPRYRSLPRRTRRQRQIEASALDTVDTLSNEELEQRLVAQQERLFRRLYPHLAASSPSNDERPEAERDGDGNQDPEADDLDPADARGDTLDNPSSRPHTSLRQPSSTSLRDFIRTNVGSRTRDPYNPKTSAPQGSMPASSLIRFRRRCAPILLASSPRSSSIIFHNDQRFHIDIRRQQLAPFELHPPRYATAVAATPSKLADVLTQADSSRSSGRPNFERGTTCASTSSRWTSGSAEIEAESEGRAEAEAETEMESLRSSNGSHEGLERTHSAASSQSTTIATEKGKGKGKAAVLVSTKAAKKPVQKQRFLQPSPTSGDEEEEDHAGVGGGLYAAYTPVLV